MPEISTVGRWEKEVRKAACATKARPNRSTWRSNRSSFAQNCATELIHIGQAVLNLKGTIEFFIENTFNCPTLAEAHKIAGLDARKRLTHPEMQADAISTMIAETPIDATVATA